MAERGKPLPGKDREHIRMMAEARMPKLQIAKSVGVSRNTVKKYLPSLTTTNRS